MSLPCKLILNDLERPPAVAYGRKHAAQMRLQDLPAPIASRNGRAECLARQCCSVEGDVLIDIVEVARSTFPQGLRGSVMRKNDVVAFQFNMQIFEDFRPRRPQLRDATSVDEITRWYQKTAQEEAMRARHVEIAMGQFAVERAARNFDRGDVIIP
jgi:hypothetical protein